MGFKKKYPLTPSPLLPPHTPLPRQTGLLVMGPEKGEEYLAMKTTLENNRVPTVHLSHEEFSQHIPNVNLADGDAAMVDTTAGVLFADRALKAVQV